MTLQSATDRHARSVEIAERAVREVRRATPAQVGIVVARHQAANAALAQTAVTAILAEQGISAAPEAALNALAFTTSTQMLDAMLTSAGDAGLDRLIEALVQDAGRVAETVTIAARANVGWVRHLNLPSCSRCVVLAGRVYKYSDGFERHPGDDCVTLPVKEGDQQFTADPIELLRQGMIRGLSAADEQAIREGADFNKVVNVRRSSAGLTIAGRVIARRGKPTPEGIFRIASDREEAVRLLKRFGYFL